MKDEPHSYVDLASDVVIDGDIAWLVGMSTGQHDAGQKDPAFYQRGILVPMDLHTGKLAGSVIVALTAPGWLQSALFGASLHPEGVLATDMGATRPAPRTGSRPPSTASMACARGSSMRPKTTASPTAVTSCSTVRGGRSSRQR